MKNDFVSQVDFRHSRCVIRRDTVAAENMESDMFPCGERSDHLFRDLPLVQQRLSVILRKEIEIKLSQTVIGK
jgi:hypothetical protein